MGCCGLDDNSEKRRKYYENKKAKENIIDQNYSYSKGLNENKNKIEEKIIKKEVENKENKKLEEAKTFCEEKEKNISKKEENVDKKENKNENINNIKEEKNDNKEIKLPKKEETNDNKVNNILENKKIINNQENKIKLMPYHIELRDYLDEKIDDTEVFDKTWYSDIEKDKIRYTKRSIIALFNKTFDDTEFKNIHNKPPLTLDVKSSGTFITNKLQITRNIYTAPISSFPKGVSLRMISKYMLNVKERSSWDKSLKSYTIIEGSENGKEIRCIIHNWMKSPMFFVSERDLVEKRFDFFHEGKFYSYESSVNDDYIPIGKGVTRINDVIFIQQVYEENNNIIFKACTQMNAKVSLPQGLINSTLASKLNSFYKNVIEAINKDYKEGTLVFEDNEGNPINN